MIRPVPSIAPIRVAIAVERDAEVEVLLRDETLRILEVFRHRGIGVVVGERPVDFRIEREVLARQSSDQLSARGRQPRYLHPSRSAANPAGVGYPVESGHQPVDVGVEHLQGFDFSGAVAPGALGGQPADSLDILAEERAALEHHLETVVIRRVMAAGDLDTAIHFLGRSFGVVEHRRRAQADLGTSHLLAVNPSISACSRIGELTRPS